VLAPGCVQRPALVAGPGVTHRVMLRGNLYGEPPRPGFACTHPGACGGAGQAADRLREESCPLNVPCAVAPPQALIAEVRRCSPRWLGTRSASTPVPLGTGPHYRSLPLRAAGQPTGATSVEVESVHPGQAIRFSCTTPTGPGGRAQARPPPSPPCRATPSAFCSP
jgi:hypothetical protein